MLFSSKIVPKPLTLKSIIDKTVEKFPDRLAVSFVYGEEAHTYGELGQEIERISKMLFSLGLKKGDKVALLAGNMPNWVIAYFAVVSKGLVIVPILPDFTREEIENVITHSESKVLFVGERLYGKVEDLELPNIIATIKLNNFAILHCKTEMHSISNLDKITVEEEDLAAIIYTSGTTGRSKGVLLTHKNISFVAMQAYEFQEINENDRFLSFLPLSHTYENSLGMLLPILYGASVYYLERPPTATTLLPAMDKVRPTVMLSVPLIMEKLYKNQILQKFSTNQFRAMIYKNPLLRWAIHRIAGKKLYQSFGGKLKFFGIGGARLDVAVERFLKEAKFPYSIGYGLTESAPLLAGTKVGKTKLRSTGPAVPDVELKIHEPDKDGVGEIWAKGPNVMRGYYKNPEATEEALTKDGWFKTGDLGRFDSKKRLYIMGRAKTTIIGSSGENIYPEDIESVINNDRFVVESLVVEEDGFLVAKIILNIDELESGIDSLKAHYEMRKEQGKQALKGFDEWLAGYKRDLNKRLNRSSQIKRIDVMEEPFEKTASQKIKRFLYTKGQGDKKEEKKTISRIKRKGKSKEEEPKIETDSKKDN